MKTIFYIFARTWESPWVAGRERAPLPLTSFVDIEEKIQKGNKKEKLEGFGYSLSAVISAEDKFALGILALQR